VGLRKFTTKQLALGAFGVGLLTTPLIIFGIFQLPGRWTDIVGIPLVWPWWLIAKYGTQVLPVEMAGAYDPIGHPFMHVIGVLANAVYLGIFVYFIGRVFFRAKGHGSPDAA
jgi:hypothetical protein